MFGISNKHILDMCCGSRMFWFDRNHPDVVFCDIRSESHILPDGKEIVSKLRVDDNKAFNSALKRAGIDDFRFHDLRHTWASWLIQSGVPLSVLQEMGGWESIEMVRRYAHLSPGHLTEHAKKIDDALLGYVTNTAQANLVSTANVV